MGRKFDRSQQVQLPVQYRRGMGFESITVQLIACDFHFIRLIKASESLGNGLGVGRRGSIGTDFAVGVVHQCLICIGQSDS